MAPFKRGSDLGARFVDNMICTVTSCSIRFDRFSHSGFRLQASRVGNARFLRHRIEAFVIRGHLRIASGSSRILPWRLKLRVYICIVYTLKLRK